MFRSYIELSLIVHVLSTSGLKTAAMPAVRNMFCSNNIHERIVASTAIGIHGLIYGRFGIGNEAIGPHSLVRFVSY